MEISKVIDAINKGRIKITDHAKNEAAEDRLSLERIFFSTVNGEIIETYPKDTPYPSCLVYGYTSKEEPIHSVWAYNESSGWAVLVTVYRPDPMRWIDYRKRKKL